MFSVGTRPGRSSRYELQYDVSEDFSHRITSKDVIAFAYAHQPFTPGPTVYYALVHEFGRSMVEDVFDSISPD
jgi:hypothetical protein